MAKLIFLEGISGVGKSTMARSLCEDLQAKGLAAKAYLEFDYTNPIYFYCVAYYAAKEYEMLLTDNPENEASISSNTINAGKARLIHYFNEDTPLFEEPLLSEFMEREFCYNPRYPVSFEGYTEAYVAVWKNFAANLADNEIVIFDGSLLHHPLNDMIRNYNASKESAHSHIQKLLTSLGEIDYAVYYLQTEDIAKQLTTAHFNRGQQPPSETEISFWQRRFDYDMYILRTIPHRSFNIDNQWKFVKLEILETICMNLAEQEVHKKDIQILRIKKYESYMDEATLLIRTDKNSNRLKYLISELEAYYESIKWRKDFENDESGLLPKKLPRGVLSEDGIYNLLEEYREVSE